MAGSSGANVNVADPSDDDFDLGDDDFDLGDDKNDPGGDDDNPGDDNNDPGGDDNDPGGDDDDPGDGNNNAGGGNYFWPPVLRVFEGMLMGPDAEPEGVKSPERVHDFLYSAVNNLPLFPGWNDAQLAAVRVAKGDNILAWTDEEQARWIKRRPIGEWLFYLDEETRAAYEAWPNKADTAVSPPDLPPAGFGDAPRGQYVRRKGANQRYAQHELPEDDDMARRVQNRRNRKQKGNNNLLCRMCFLNNKQRDSVRVTQCSRVGPVGGGRKSAQTPAHESCDRCARFGIVCLDLDGRVLDPRPDKIATGLIENQVRFFQCTRCFENGLNCDRTHPCRECRSAIPGAVSGRDCVYRVSRHGNRGAVFNGAAVGDQDPEYYMGMGYGPWGIGTRRPLARPDLPGPSETETLDGNVHPLYESVFLGSRFRTRQEVLDHLQANNNEFDWDPLLQQDAIAAAQALPLYAPQGRGAPAPSVPPVGAQGVASAFLPPQPAADLPLELLAEFLAEDDIYGPYQPYQPYQAQQEGDFGDSAAPSPLHSDAAFDPPNIDPNLAEVANRSPPGLGAQYSAFNENLVDPDLERLLVRDPDAMDLDFDFNFPQQPAPAGEGAYGGGLDLQALLGNNLEAGPDGDALVANRPQPPNEALALNNEVEGEARPPTSPLPLTGPQMAANAEHLPPFGTEAWNLDLKPGGAWDQVAGLTVPTVAIPMVDPEVLSGRECEEVDPDGVRCRTEAVAKCVDRWHVHKNEHKYICRLHDALGKTMADALWEDMEKLDLRAYPCAACLRSIVLASETPYRATGTKLFGMEPPADGGDDPPKAILAGDDGVVTEIGGSQGRKYNHWTGCNCAKKLLNTYQCMAHRTQHLQRIQAQARRMKEWRVSLSRDGSKTCFLCRENPGVDHYNFTGRNGGSNIEYLLYMCLLCQGVVVTAPDVHAEPYSRIQTRNALKGPIDAMYTGQPGPDYYPLPPAAAPQPAPPGAPVAVA